MRLFLQAGQRGKFLEGIQLGDEAPKPDQTNTVTILKSDYDALQEKANQFDAMCGGVVVTYEQSIIIAALQKEHPAVYEQCARSALEYERQNIIARLEEEMNRKKERELALLAERLGISMNSAVLNVADLPEPKVNADVDYSCIYDMHERTKAMKAGLTQEQVDILCENFKEDTDLIIKGAQIYLDKHPEEEYKGDTYYKGAKRAVAGKTAGLSSDLKRKFQGLAEQAAMKPELSEPVKVALQEVLNKIEQVEESDADFLDRMKQVICENKDMDSADLDRLLALKGKTMH